MKYNHNQICTDGNEIIVGGHYQYYESLPLIVADVEVLEDNSDKEYIAFKVKVTNDSPMAKKGEEFEISAMRGHYAYSGMWRLYPLGTYLNKPG